MSLSIFFSMISIYFFIFLGYLAKRIFKEELQPKTLTLLSVYFFQPFVALWGFTSAPLHLNDLLVPLLYILLTLILLLPTYLIGRYAFSHSKERAIFTIAGFLGNTGNMGIPLGLALFGTASLLYTTLINLANLFIAYILGVYIYSRGSFSVRESLLNIVKIPIIPASMLAIVLNLLGFSPSQEIAQFLQMGAFTGIVLQLFLLGTFLEGIKLKKLNKKLLSATLLQKFLLIPLATLLLLPLTPLPLWVQGVILMEMMMPLAIANINLASLYECQPYTVTTLIFLSTLLFIPILFFIKPLIACL